MADSPILPPACRDDLRRFHAEAERAKREYNIALTSALRAIDIDPARLATVDLDTGVLTLHTPAPALVNEA